MSPSIPYFQSPGHRRIAPGRHFSPFQPPISPLWGVLILVGLLGLAPALASAAEVTFLNRPVEIKPRAQAEWRVLKLGDAVNEGDAIRTGFGGRVEITISKKRVFRVGEATEIELPELGERKAEGVRAKFNLLLGRFWGGLIRPLRDPDKERFQVTTPTATIGVKGTSFGVDYDKKLDTSQVLVLDGTVAAVPPGQEVNVPVEIAGPREVAPPQEISLDEWLLLVSQDQKVIIRPGEVPQVEPLTPEDKEDEWVKFNNERDQALAAQ